MNNKILTAYELGEEWDALLSLLNDLTDEETGETRELTEEEKAFFEEETNKIGGDIKYKMDGLCKVFKNYKMKAEIAEAEKNSLKSEMERLSKRAKARENEANRVKYWIGYLMDKVGLKNIKTDLFSASFQSTAKSAKPIDGFFNADNIPVKLLKRELSSSAIKEAIKDGWLYEKEGIENRTKLFYMENGQEKLLKGVTFIGSEFLMIR